MGKQYREKSAVVNAEIYRFGLCWNYGDLFYYHLQKYH